MPQSEKPFEYDAAISFLSRDLALANEIHASLSPALRTFVYTRAQEAIAATDGMETFRTVFRDRARLSVVLFRDGWGKTPWTGVEELAIRDRCLQTKYRSLVFVALDDSDTPNWIPDAYQRFDLQSYPVAQLVGVIKARADEFGAEIRAPSNADRAIAQERRRAFDAETDALLANGPNEFTAARDALFQAIRDEAAVVAASAKIKIESGPGAVIGGFVVTTGGQTVQLVVRDLYANTARNAFLELRKYNATVPVAEPNVAYTMWERLEPAGFVRLSLSRLPVVGWCWDIEGRELATRDAASAVLGILLDRVDEAAKRNRAR